MEKLESTVAPTIVHASPPVMQALHLITAGYAEAKLTHRTVATTVGISSEHLCRLLKQHTGDTFVTLLRRARIDAARRLLQSSNLSMKEIAGRVGFSSASQFDRGFKRICGVPPTVYRRAMAIADAPKA
jgi:two-component system response regulator YesN